jgi:hypothetical protein
VSPILHSVPVAKPFKPRMHITWNDDRKLHRKVPPGHVPTVVPPAPPASNPQVIEPSTPETTPDRKKPSFISRFTKKTV